MPILAIYLMNHSFNYSTLMGSCRESQPLSGYPNGTARITHLSFTPASNNRREVHVDGSKPPHIILVRIKKKSVLESVRPNKYKKGTGNNLADVTKLWSFFFHFLEIRKPVKTRYMTMPCLGYNFFSFLFFHFLLNQTDHYKFTHN